MKKLLAAALVTASLAASAIPGFAGEGEGVVSQIDMETRTIVLEDGSTWTAAEGVDLTAVAPGDAVMVTYDDGTTVVTAIAKKE